MWSSSSYAILPQVIHHLFLTRLGVYCVVFNMEWLISTDTVILQRALSTLKFWVNSIVVHTLHENADNVKVTAPIVFIGTRKDVVSKLEDHVKISDMLYETFQKSLAWPQVIEYKVNSEEWLSRKKRRKNEAEYQTEPSNLYFFPINNVLSGADPIVPHLLTVIGETMIASRRPPPTWLLLIDKLVSPKYFLSFEETCATASLCGVTPEEVVPMLEFFHEMGFLMFRKYRESYTSPLTT